MLVTKRNEIIVCILLCFWINPRPPEVFFVTRPPKRGVVATPQNFTSYTSKDA